MKGTMQISKLKKKAAYYYNKTYNRKYKDYNIFFMEPFEGTNDDYFYYVKRLDNGKIEISGELHLFLDCHLQRYQSEARARMKDIVPAYYWLDENGEVTEKTYY